MSLKTCSFLKKWSGSEENEVKYFKFPTGCLTINNYFNRALHYSQTGMFLWADSREFPQATMILMSGYFHRKINEKYNKKISLAVWLNLAYLFYLPSSLKS